MTLSIRLIAVLGLIALCVPALADTTTLTFDPDKLALRADLPPETRAARLHTGPASGYRDGVAIVHPKDVREINYAVADRAGANPTAEWRGIDPNLLPIGWTIWVEAEDADGGLIGSSGIARIPTDAVDLGELRASKSHRCNCDCDCYGYNYYWWESEYGSYHNCRHHDCCCDELTDGELILIGVVVGAAITAEILEECSLSSGAPSGGVFLMLGALISLAYMRRRHVSLTAA